MHKHVTVIGTLHIGLSILGLLLGVGLYFLLVGIGVMQDDYEAAQILTVVGTVVGIFFIAISVPGLIGGIGLLKYQEWARILILIVSAFNLVNIPFGTVVGGYSIWVLVQDETQQLFAEEH